MTSGLTVLMVLRKASELLGTGKSACIISAISSLKEQSSGRTRDLAYFAILDTMTIRGAQTTFSWLAKLDNQADALMTIEATIKRIRLALH